MNTLESKKKWSKVQWSLLRPNSHPYIKNISVCMKEYEVCIFDHTKNHFEDVIQIRNMSHIKALFLTVFYMVEFKKK